MLQILSLNTYNDLLLKCKYEYQELQRCSSHPEYDFILFNLVLGLNHLFEWYFKENKKNEKLQIECIKKFNPYNSPYDVSRDFKDIYRELENFPAVNLDQETIRKLCNKAKHFKKQNIEKPVINNPSPAGSTEMQCGEPNAVCSSFHYLYFVEIEGKDKNLSDIISNLLEQWINFSNSTSGEAE